MKKVTGKIAEFGTLTQDNQLSQEETKQIKGGGWGELSGSKSGGDE